MKPILYDIYLEERFDIGMRDHDEIETRITLIGSQFAVSERQAVSRFCWKNNLRSSTIIEQEGDTGRECTVFAKEHATRRNK